MTPPQVWREFSYRQILGLYEMYADKKKEELIFSKALHGVLSEEEIRELEHQDQQPISNSDDALIIDLTKCKTPEEYRECVRRLKESKLKQKLQNVNS